MIEKFYCCECHAFLVETNLKRLKHVEIKCPMCEAVNVFDYDPKKYVKKGQTANGRSLFD